MASESTEVAHGAAEAGHAAAEHYVGMPQLNFDWYANQIFWLAVTLVIIYLILSRVALPRIASVLAERHSAIANDLERAEALKQKAVEAEEAYNKALADARAEAGQIVAAAKQDIQKDLDVAISHADAEIAAKTVESEGRIGDIRNSAMQAVEEVALATATAIVRKLMPSIDDKKAVSAAVKARMKGVN
ncbi:MAG: F0F1 ATP synthase subunit B' [Rhodobacterales bacterium]|jgi:F-type H+-transporting ATPase subunit b|nr:F0F1 ATP synthase subunit B' [Pseudomonadota bacterium]MDA1287662.1 F0F1 ATP synthase subunit B' [Pseudomonadota bacterium]HBN31240.1 ATP F0F1 synthase subunit B' [Paracoccaceae bacterium]